MKAAGIFSIAMGLFALCYGTWQYVWPEEIASVGSLHLTVEPSDSSILPAILGALALASGVALLFIHRSGAKS